MESLRCGMGWRETDAHITEQLNVYAKVALNNFHISAWVSIQKKKKKKKAKKTRKWAPPYPNNQPHKKKKKKKRVKKTRIWATLLLYVDFVSTWPVLPTARSVAMMTRDENQSTRQNSSPVRGRLMLASNCAPRRRDAFP